MYSGLDLVRDVHHRFDMQPARRFRAVRAAPIVQPQAECPPIPWYERSGKVRSLVGSLPNSFDMQRSFDGHAHVFDAGMCITCNKREH